MMGTALPARSSTPVLAKTVAAELIAASGERRAQVVPHHGNELFPQLGALALVQQRFLAVGDPLLRIQVERDQTREQLEHSHRLRGVQDGGTRVDCTQRAEELAVRKPDRHRDIALETVLCRRRVVAVGRVLIDVVDDHELAAVPNLAAEGCCDLELAAGLEAKRDLVTNGTGDPAIGRHPRHGCKSELRGPADDFQEALDRRKFAK